MVHTHTYIYTYTQSREYYLVTSIVYYFLGVTSREVLLNMKAYMAVYFLCEECRNNFALEAVSVEDEATDNRESVLWLWSTHNRVNQRLHTQGSEDPGYPKVQFNKFISFYFLWIVFKSSNEHSI